MPDCFVPANDNQCRTMIISYLNCFMPRNDDSRFLSIRITSMKWTVNSLIFDQTNTVFDRFLRGGRS